MKTNTLFMRQTMDDAQNLQDRYNQLGAAGTQAIRNPLPMHALILTVIPSLPAPIAILDTQVRTKMTIAGRDFIKKVNAKAFAKDVLPADYWIKKAVSIDEIMATLKERGFIVNRGGIATAILLNGNLQSIHLKKQVKAGHDRRGCSYKRYFLESK
jgi:hypothetical protein